MALDNKYITVAYRLYTIEDGEEDTDPIEECSVAHPFQFISKLGVVLPAFEAGVEKVEKGGTFDFVIPCKDAYGEFQDELMFDVEKSIFCVNGEIDSRYIYEGAVVPMQGEDGNTTGVEILEAPQSINDAVLYDLYGRKVTTPVKGGIYISNGKKVIVK